MDEDSYRDEQLVELYDSDNAARDDHQYYRTLADTVEATRSSTSDAAPGS